MVPLMKYPLKASNKAGDLRVNFTEAMSNFIFLCNLSITVSNIDVKDKSYSRSAIALLLKDFLTPVIKSSSDSYTNKSQS